MSPSQDTRLARLLHERGRLPLRDLLALLEEARRSQGALTLAQLLSERSLATSEELRGWLRDLGPDGAVEPARQGWSVGDEVAGLRIEAKLGEGGMGAVYRALDLASGGRVAVKTLAASADPEERVRFEREAQAQAAVDAHPNVVRIHRSGVAEGRAYLVMELASGGDLKARIARGPLPPREAATLLRDLARGLSHVHAQGVLHRDLKPANVVFDERGTPKLADFGLARAEGAETLTQTGTVLGTPSHMAPEQIEAKRGEIGEAADVYGLGALLYHCLSQSPPFSSGSLYEVLLAVLETRPTPPSELLPGVPPALEALCLRALEKDPALRPVSAAAFAEDLEAFLAGEAERAARGWVPALGATIFVVLAVGLGLAFFPEVDDRLPPVLAPPQSPPPQAWALQEEARRRLVAGHGDQGLAAVDSALALSDPRTDLAQELERLRSQAQLILGQLNALPGALPREDLPLVPIVRARAQLERSTAARTEMFAWVDLQEQGDLLASDALSVRGTTPWLGAVIRRQVADSLITIAFQTPKGTPSRVAVEGWFRKELPRLLNGDAPRIRIARGLFIVSRLDEYKSTPPPPSTLPSAEGLEPRWAANLEVLRLLSLPPSRAEPYYFRLAKRAPPLFPGANLTSPAEVSAQHKVTNAVASVAEARAFRDADRDNCIDPESFRIALAHRAQGVAQTQGVPLLDPSLVMVTRVRHEELLSCLGDHEAIAASPLPTKARPLILARARMTRAESAIDRGDAPAARAFLEEVYDRSSLDYETLFARLEALEGDLQAAEDRLARAETKPKPLLAWFRSIKVTRQILAGRDPRLPLRKALGR